MQENLRKQGEKMKKICSPHGGSRSLPPSLFLNLTRQSTGGIL
jgi:hypothetical protein